ncbi:MAG TPA: BrnA antitoxin family protein [Caulobacteraceae bacterium]|nr:BrnA antitoxin family protein [Caulobacteraceae bacterium]
MTGKGRGAKSDLAKVDSHEPGPADYAEIPELPDEWFAAARPHAAGKPRGRPRAATPRQAVNLRLSQRVLAGFRATGPGWQTRINAALEQWLDRNPPER